MDVTLPNGTVIRGVPEGTSKDDVKNRAIAAGLATEGDFQAPQTIQQEPQQPVSFAQAITGNAPVTPEMEMQARLMGGGMFGGEDLSGLSPQDRARREDINAIPEILSISPSGLLAGENPAGVMALAPTLLMTTNPEEMGQILHNQYPHIGVVHTPEGEMIAVNNKTGARAMLNRPGWSQQDTLQALGLAAAFTPAGRASGVGLSSIAKGAGGALATQSAIETAQQQVGGEVDPGEIALSGALQAGGQTAGEFLSGLLRSATGRMSPEAASLLQAGERAQTPIMTSDVLPPRTYFGKSAQTLFERIPIVGTAGRRALQQEAREGAVHRLAAEFGVTPEIPFTEQVIDSLEAVKSRRWAEASNLKNSARQALSESGEAVSRSNFQEAIDQAIETEMAFGSQADEALIRSLQAWKDAPQGDFGFVDSLRSRLGDEISDYYRGQNSQIGSKGVQYLQRMKNALTDDMNRFAERSGNTEAFRDWRRANQMFTEEYGKFQLSALKGLLDRGEIEPERVMSVLSGNRPSQSALLYQNLTPDGRAAAKGAIISDMMDRSRNNMGVVDPDRLLTQMRRMDKNLKVFFRGEDEQVLNGFREVLRNTQRASRAELSTPTGQELYYLGLGGAAMANAPMTATAVGAASLGRMYESGPVRNAMLRLANTRPGSTQYDRALRNAIDTLTAAGQAERQTDEE